jgi:hypothetical protein
MLRRDNQVDFWTKLLSYINLAGAIHALIQSMVLFFSRKGNRRANRIMAVFLLALAIGMANGIFSVLGLYDKSPALVILMGSVALAYGPLFYLYIRAMTAAERPWTPADVFHAVPFLLGMLAYGAYLRSPVGGPASPGIIGWVVRYPWLAVTILSTLQTVVYLASVIRLLRGYSEGIKATYSTIDRINLAGSAAPAIYAAIWVIALVMIAAARFEPGARPLMQIVAFLTALNIFATGTGRANRDRLGPSETKPGRRYERSSLTPKTQPLYNASTRAHGAEKPI